MHCNELPLYWLINTLEHSTYELTNQNSPKVTKGVKPTNKKTLGTSVINSLLSPLSLWTYKVSETGFLEHELHIEIQLKIFLNN